VTAILLVQVLAAFDAKPLAIGLAERADGNLQQGIFAQEFRHVEVRIFGQNKPRLGFGAFVICVQLGEGPIQFVLEVRQTARRS
jgi:hypothetical protein